ncbi:hypothetical protein NDU88_006469 [Pleurodeles waltl]|uniref:Uncharacterized protein n=1 Tax=Pleurodeles waltl TaxID=8319 RepID=A0AAV7N1E4_PLEWA|nr:hypothetical protein NDU88_006469 [Pleurodeles waltl]
MFGEVAEPSKSWGCNKRVVGPASHCKVEERGEPGQKWSTGMTMERGTVIPGRVQVWVVNRQREPSDNKARLDNLPPRHSVTSSAPLDT